MTNSTTEIKELEKQQLHEQEGKQSHDYLLYVIRIVTILSIIFFNFNVIKNCKINVDKNQRAVEAPPTRGNKQPTATITTVSSPTVFRIPEQFSATVYSVYPRP